jgi:hypothetical protein
MSNISPGYIFGIVLFAALIVVCLGMAASYWKDDEPWKSSAVVFLVVPGVFLVWFGINHPAFDMEYHSYQQIEGKVTEIERDNDVRMFELKGDPRDLSCTEPWCTKVEVGDTLTLDCVRDNGVSDKANVWECEFVSSEETDRV